MMQEHSFLEKVDEQIVLGASGQGSSCIIRQ